MTKEKRKYNVYLQTTCFDGFTGETSTRKEFIGTTYAVSDSKAVSNMAFRLNKSNHFPMSGYDHADWCGDGGRDSYLVA